MTNHLDPSNSTTTPDSSAGAELARTVLSRLTSIQRFVSPWVQRQLASRGSASRSREPLPAMALTQARTAVFLKRVQRRGAEAAVWRPDIGSLSPQLVDRFSKNVISRFVDMETRLASRTSYRSQEPPPLDFPLAGLSEEEAPSAEPQGPVFPFTVDQVREALERHKAGLPPIPPETPAPPAESKPPASPAPVQRKAKTPSRSPAFPFSVAEVRAALEQPHFSQAPKVAQRAPASPSDRPERASPPPRRRAKIEELPSSAGQRHPAPPGGPAVPLAEDSESEAVQRAAAEPRLPGEGEPPVPPPPGEGPRLQAVQRAAAEPRLPGEGEPPVPPRPREGPRAEASVVEKRSDVPEARAERPVPAKAELPLATPGLPGKLRLLQTKPVEKMALLPQTSARLEDVPPPHRGPESFASSAGEPGTEKTSPGAGTQAGKMPLPLARPDYSGAASRRETRQWREAGASTGKADHQDVVQRVPAENTLPSPVSDAGKRIVQRAVDQPSMPGAEEKQNRPDLDALARQVYPLVKRLLSVERERWPF